MNAKQTLKEGLARIRKENDEIRKRRENRMKELLKARSSEDDPIGFAASLGRFEKRLGQPGTPRSVIYAMKMTIPKKRRRK